MYSLREALYGWVVIVEAEHNNLFGMNESLHTMKQCTVL